MAASIEKGPTGKRKRSASKATRCDIRLFVAGDEPNSALAKASLRRICAEYLQEECRVETIDVLRDFQPALQENILVTPALVIQRDKVRTVILGNLTNIDRVLTALHIEH